MTNSNPQAQRSSILVLDFGSQYAHLITRRFRDLGHWSELIPIHASMQDAPKELETAKGIVLSGGPNSVEDEGAPVLPKWVLDSNLPVLGICYGMQLLAKEFGSTLEPSTKREYGSEPLKFTNSNDVAPLFQETPDNQTVWMSHGDSITKLGPDWTATAQSAGGTLAGIRHNSKNLFGIQFHPEADHTEHGSSMLKNFAHSICGMNQNWSDKDRLEFCTQEILRTVGEDHKVLVALSGGVDSSVLALLLNQILGPDRVIPVFVDHGLLRQGEREWVKEKLHAAGLTQLLILDERERFLGELKDVSEPEKKREKIGHAFIASFQNFAKQHSQDGIHFLAQGTLYPDVIESGAHGSNAEVIKSHHNVGGLPDVLGFELLEPFRFLYKDEVRKIGSMIGLDQDIVGRHPFPGPGLAIRIMGSITEENLELAKKSDKIFIDSLKDDNLYHDVWQALTVILPVESVGVMGDSRTYEKVCALRAVSAKDGMSADVSPLPLEFLTKVASKIVREVRGINRVVYDVTTKPPATIEWE